MLRTFSLRQGVCKLGGLTVFCARALPGEVLRARIVSVKKAHALVRRSLPPPEQRTACCQPMPGVGTHGGSALPRGRHHALACAQAEKLGTVVAHNDAVPARCAHYGQGCGGCALQDLAYAAQLRAKHRQVRGPPVKMTRALKVPLSDLLSCLFGTWLAHDVHQQWCLLLGLHRPGNIQTALLLLIERAQARSSVLSVLWEVREIDRRPACGGQVVDVLQRIGRVADAAALVRPVLAAAQPLAYRNKMTFTLRARERRALPCR